MKQNEGSSEKQQFEGRIPIKFINCNIKQAFDYVVTLSKRY